MTYQNIKIPFYSQNIESEQILGFYTIKNLRKIHREYQTGSVDFYDLEILVTVDDINPLAAELKKLLNTW